MHLEIQKLKKGCVGILRTSYREGKKTLHKQLGRITDKTLEELKLLQLAFCGKVIPENDPKALKIISSKEYGASYSILEVAKETKLDKALYSRNEPWVSGVLAMIIGRIIYAGSKLSLCNQYNNTNLFELVGINKKPEVEQHCYLPLDRLLERQDSIQRTLAKKHLNDGCMVLYDITSSYLEGSYQESELVKFGYNRDRKNGHKQIVIGLICNKEGCPVAIETFAGNTKDETTVIEKVKELKHKYKLKKLIFVGDRGMLTKCNIEQLEQTKEISIITALTHGQIRLLLDNKTIQLGLFDDRNINEVIDPETQKRYCLCRNPLKAKEAEEVRNKLIELTEKGLQEIANYKIASTVEVIGARVGKILAKYKVAKFIKWSVTADTENNKSKKHQLIWNIDQDKLSEEKRFDGCYIITTNVPIEDMNAQEVVASYKKLILVEQAFRNLKTVQLDMRPIYHKKDERIKAHVFLCMLAYYLQWHMKQKLKALFDRDGNGKERRWSFDGIISTLKQITINEVSIGGSKIFKVSEATPEQSAVLKHLGVNLQPSL
jgi:transposase